MTHANSGKLIFLTNDEITSLGCRNGVHTGKQIANALRKKMGWPLRISTKDMLAELNMSSSDIVKEYYRMRKRDM